MRDRTVGVVGGGDSALQEALTLAEAVGEVIVLQRGDALTAQAAYREPALAHPKISVRYGTVVEEILGEDAVSGVRTARRRVGRHAGARARRRCSSTSAWSPTASSLARPARARRRRARPDRRVAADRARRACSRPASCAAARSAQAAISAGEGAAAAKAAHRHLADGRAATDTRRPRPPEATEAHMAEKLTVHDPARLSAAGHRQAARAAAAEPRGPDALPRRLPVRQLRGLRRPAARAGSPSTCPASSIKRIKPRESWVDDPEMCAAIQADGDAAVLAVGL